MADKKLLSFYGAKISEDGTKVVVTLISGEGEEKEFYTACVKLNNSQKTHAKIEGDYALIKIPVLKEKVEVADGEILPF